MNKKEVKKESPKSEPTQRTDKKKKWMMKSALVTIASVLVVGALVGVSVALAYSQEKINSQASYQREMEAAYSRAYYDLLDGTNDLDVKLRKLSVSATAEKQQSLLYEVWGAANLAENNLSSFESNDEGLLKAEKFVNQLGDYAHYLALRMSDGVPLTPEERATLAKLQGMVGVLKTSLKSVQNNLDDGKLFMNENGALSSFAGSFKDFVSPSVEYPEMIYDGPFSDALEIRQPKGLSGKDIDENGGLSLIKKYFADRQTENINYEGETAGDIVTHNYSMMLDGNRAYAQIAKKGGMLISLNLSKDVSSSNANAAEGLSAVMKFIESMGHKDFEVVWSSTANGMTYVNLAPVINDTIIYPDLIKVKVSESSGEVIGYDAMHYAFNHTERTLETPQISQEEAKSRITLNGVSEGRLALIPLQETKELLTYEFECESDGTYFIYIDAATGKEANILYVIETPQGLALQ